MWERMKQRPWFYPFAISFAIHLCALLALWFIHVTTHPEAEVHMTPKFRLKGVEHLPRIPGKPGGGQPHGNTQPLQFINRGKVNALVSAKDAAVDSLVRRQMPPDEVSIDEAPKKIEMEGSSLISARDFEAVATKTEERQLKDKVQSKQQSTAGASTAKILSRKSDRDNLLRFLSKPLAGLNLQGSENVGIDPEEGMPGFTPIGTGGGGGGGAGSGSPGGFADGVDQGVGESKAAIAKYGALDDVMDVQVFTYRDPSDSKKYFMIKILAKKDAKVFHVMPKEIIFTIDCSLSIRKDRLVEMQRGIHYCLEHLNKEDLFNIIAFKDETSFFSKKSLPATANNIKQAKRFVLELTASQRTDVYSAFKDIVQLPLGHTPSNVILISDGRPTYGLLDSRDVINSITRINQKTRPIFAFSGGAKVNRYLLDFVSYQNRAWSQFVKNVSGIHEGLADFYNKIKDPLFLNLRYHLNNLDEDEVFPKSLPDFYRNAEFTLYGTYNHEDTFAMQLLGDVDGETKELVFTRSLKDAPEGNTDIMKGYAFNKIYYLISRMTAHSSDKETLNEINALSQRYGVQTPYSPDIKR